MADLGTTSIIPSNRPNVRTRVVAEGGAWLFSLAVIIFLATLVFSAGLFLYRRSLESARANWNEQIAAQESDLRSELLDQLIILANSLSSASELIANHVFPTKPLELVEETTHTDVRFNSFTLDVASHKLDLFGTARSYRAVADQTRVLEAHPRVESVEFGGLSRGAESGLVSFRLTIVFKPNLIRQPGI